MLGASVLTMSSQAPAATPAPSNQPPSSTVGTIGMRLLDEPAATADDPRARLYLIDSLAPGAVIHRRIDVSNTASTTQHAVLYAAAASIAHGAFIGAVGPTANEISTWTSITPGAVNIPAGSTITANVTIAVPTDAAVGERYGAIWAEISTAASSPSDITQVNRVGIREYISVGAGAAPASNFTIDSMTAQRTGGGQPQVVALVHNSGGRALDMSGTLNLSDGPGGLRAGPFAATLGTTLSIGDTEAVTITLNKQLPAGPWTADLSLASGLLQRSAQATLMFPNSGSASPARVSTHSPWQRRLLLSGLGLALLAGTAGLLIALRSRRRATATAHRRPR